LIEDRGPQTGAGEQPALQEALVVVGAERRRQVQRRGDQGVDVDLAGAGEDDAVAIDEIDLTVGLDLALDLARHTGRIIDLVERHPAGIAPLVEVDRGVG
jgi:hypothetical protein